MESSQKRKSSFSYTDCVLVICKYILNLLLVCRTFIHFCTYMCFCEPFVRLKACVVYYQTTTVKLRNMTNISKLKPAFKHPLNPVYFMFTTILRHITNAASSKLPLYKTKTATIS